MRRATVALAAPRPVAMPTVATPAPIEGVTGAARQRAIAAACADGPVALRLGGGDVLMLPELPALVAQARAAGATAVQVTTTALALANAGTAGGLRALGVSAIAVPLFGADADAHDWIAGAPGAMARALRGIRAARAAGLDVDLIAPVLRPSYRGLDRLVGSALALGVRAVELPLLAPGGDSAASWCANPAVAAASVRRALAVAAAARREASASGFPACLLAEPSAMRPPPAQRFGGREHFTVDSASDPAHSHAEVCAACRWRAHCPGVAPTTLRSFGSVGWIVHRDVAPQSGAAEVAASTAAEVGAR